MLCEFLIENEQELVARYRIKVATRRAPRISDADLDRGIPAFLRQVIDALRTEQPSTPAAIIVTAGEHGTELLRTGFAVAEVVHDYGDLCKAIVEIAAEANAHIAIAEFQAFNRCLEDAIAGAVTAYSRASESSLYDEAGAEINRRLRFLAHELRNLLGSATLSFDVIKRTTTPLDGTTTALHDRALRGLGHLIDSSLMEVRLPVRTDA